MHHLFADIVTAEQSEKRLEGVFEALGNRFSGLHTQKQTCEKKINNARFLFMLQYIHAYESTLNLTQRHMCVG